MKVLDLFSGIGGFALGLERAGMEIAAFCEIDDYRRRVLRRHWPSTPIFGDIKKLEPDHVGSVDVICGGPPCQPLSQASRGRAKGVGDKRWLWPEMFRIICGLKPSWVVLENSTRLDGLALGQIVSDLEGDQYKVQAFDIPACAVGTDHIRPRRWVVGHADRDLQSIMSVDAKMGWLQRRRNQPCRA